MTTPGPVLFDGIWFPVDRRDHFDRYKRHSRDSDPAIRRCRQRRTVVQAGAHVGFWPRRLAAKFQRVVTFEPDDANWECLVRNIRGRDRIEAHRAMLGPETGVGTLRRHANNTGGHRTLFNGGDRVVMCIDQFGIEDCDLICLDVEGSELPALKGATETIRRTRPVIIYEERGHGTIHGLTAKDTQNWLRKMGYEPAGTVAKDQLWVPA